MTIGLFLVAPDAIEPSLLVLCSKAASEAANCASILVAETVGKNTVEQLQALGLAVILRTDDTELVQKAEADGMQPASTTTLKNARNILKNLSLGFDAGVSRHLAMEAAEAGADYVAFTQTKQYVGEPIIGWWQELTDIPAVATDPVVDAGLKKQRPDFIRPSDDMWKSPEAAKAVVSTLMDKWLA